MKKRDSSDPVGYKDVAQIRYHHTEQDGKIDTK